MIQLENVSKSYKNGVHALRNINLTIEDGEFVYIIGPTGSGKSTLIKLLDGEEIPNSGTVMVENINVGKLKHSKVPVYRRNIGVVFQDFRLLPRMTIFENIAFALEVIGMKKVDIRRRVREVLELVSLQDKAKAFPDELSGGQQQRATIGRAIANHPKVLIADEPTTALDVTIQAQILSLMKGLQKEYETAIMFITHDLGVIAETADRVMVMYAGQVVEEADVRSIFHNPVHPYTRGLLNSTVRVHEIADRLETIDGVVPTLSKMPKGCRFAPRCPYACDTCRATIPQLRSVGDCPGHYARCIRAGGEQA